MTHLVILLFIVIFYVFYYKDSVKYKESFNYKEQTFCRNDINKFNKFNQKIKKLKIKDYLEPTLNKRLYTPLKERYDTTNSLLDNYNKQYDILVNKISETKDEEKKSYQSLNTLNKLNNEYQKSLMKNSIISEDYSVLN